MDTAWKKQRRGQGETDAVGSGSNSNHIAAALLGITAPSFYFSWFHPKKQDCEESKLLLDEFLGILSVLTATLTHWTTVVHFRPLSPTSEPTQAPSISLALCLEPMHPSDPPAKRPLPRPFFFFFFRHLTLHLLTQCLTLPPASFISMVASHHHLHLPSSPPCIQLGLKDFLSF